MSGALFEVPVDATPLVAVLEGFEKRGGDLTPTMAVIAEDMLAAVSEEFDTEGHGKWPQLAESTLRSRRGTSAHILQDTGRWAGSNQALHGRDFAEVGTDVGYAVFHVSDAPRSVIPLRNPYDLPPEVFDRAVETILEAIVK